MESTVTSLLGFIHDGFRASSAAHQIAAVDAYGRGVALAAASAAKTNGFFAVTKTGRILIVHKVSGTGVL